MVAGFLAWRMPKSTRKPLPESTMEWIPSEIIADDPEMAAAMNLTMPTAMFDAMAANTDALLECFSDVLGAGAGALAGWDEAAGAADAGCAGSGMNQSTPFW